MVVVKQLILIMLVYIISFLPPLLVANVSETDVWILYILYINHVANFFIYPAVNTEFRNETKVMKNVLLQKVRPGNQQKTFALR